MRTETVSRVIDGDTFLTRSRKNAVRIANITSPKKGEKGGKKAAEHLRKLIQGKKVQIIPISRDIYGRCIARVKLNGLSINKAMARFLKK